MNSLIQKEKQSQTPMDMPGLNALKLQRAQQSTNASWGRMLLQNEFESCYEDYMCSGALYCCKLDTGVCEYNCKRSGFGETCNVTDPRG